MRDIVLTLLILGSVPLILVKPHIGVLMWSWISYMNPHRLTWSFAYDFRFALLIAIVTLLAWLLSREPKRVPWHPITMLLAIFTAWVSFTTLYAQFPEFAQVKWEQTIKILLFNGFLTLGLMGSRARLDALIWVIVLSIGYYGVKGGIATILGGGQFHIYGPPASFIADNNQLGLALLMALPLMRYLQLVAPNIWIKIGLTGAMLLSAIALFGTQSRGAFVGFAAVLLALMIKSRKRVLIGLALAATLAAGFAVMPDRWHARMETILTFDQEASMQSRFRAWQYGFDTAVENPIVGAGFAAFRGNRDPTSGVGYRSAHSIYFEVLGEHGFVGLAIYLILGLGTFLTCGSVLQRVRGRPELTWARDLAAMIQVSLVAFAVTGLAVNLAFFDLFYHIVAIAILTSVLVRKSILTSTDSEKQSSGRRPSTVVVYGNP